MADYTWFGSQKLGRIRMSCCLEVDARRLTINVVKVDDLPKFGITGAPGGRE